jgi:hypothetical protein
LFSRTKSKLEDTRNLLDQLDRVSDASSFRALFNSFLNSARAITYVLQKEGKHVHGFDDWYVFKQQEMRNDELLRFIQLARVEDFHEGKHALAFSTAIAGFSTDQAGSPPSVNASLVIGADGPFWLVDEGTPGERRIPIKQGGTWATRVGIKNAPTKHRGRTLERNDPITICRVALVHFSELVHEAMRSFGS